MSARPETERPCRHPLSQRAIVYGAEYCTRCGEEMPRDPQPARIGAEP